jgi:ankyrin repeat protein
MRLLQIQDNGELSLVERVGSKIPPYAILSHTWGHSDEETTYQDMLDGTGKEKRGYCKVTFCKEQAARDGFRYFWIDTCCIDKSSSAELSEAITSMFRWYQNSAQCYVYLSDVLANKRKTDYDTFRCAWESAFRTSRWFSRGWTLQELLAPPTVKFFSGDGKQLGDKASLEQHIHDVTHIPVSALQGAPLHRFDIEERMSWTRKRQTTREEDEAYSLLGVFNISMLPNYGEGKKSAFRRLRKEIIETLGDLRLPLGEQQKRMLLDSLRFDQIDARQTTIKNAHAKTCKWLLKDARYLDWLDVGKLSEHHGFLWIKGKPGTGKSTLMKFALMSARKTMKDSILASFFFNARGGDMEKSTIGAYRSLLLQLLERLPALQSVFSSLGLSTSSSGTDYQWNVESLKMLVEQAIRALGESSVVCFVDALDECEEEQIRDMIQFFEHIGELAMLNGIRFQVCLSSRHYPYITIRRGLDLVLEGQEGHSQDITNYVESELKIGQSKVAQQIRSELQVKASGVFMWVALVVGILNKEHDRGRTHALRRRLQETPGDLHELFRDILTRDSRNKDDLVLCIQWVLFAKQPLSPEQLYFAILSGVEPETVAGWDCNEITVDVIERFILDSSKGLVEITTSKLPKVQFIHESVRDFLLKEDGLSNICSDLQSNFQGRSHEQLKHCCLTYMSTNAVSFLKVPESLQKVTSKDVTHLRKTVTDVFPFLEYAVQNILHHADAAEGNGISQETFVQSFSLDRWIKMENLFERHEVRRHTERMSPLYLFCEHNLSNLIKAQTPIFSYLEVGDERYGPPLLAALATGSRKVLQLFLEALETSNGPKNSTSRICRQYFMDESEKGSRRRNFKFSKRRTILSYLTEFGESEIIALLLKSDHFDIIATAESKSTILHWAAEKGCETTLKFLLKMDQINISPTDKDMRTPFSLAAYNGHESIVKLLLETGQIDVDSRDCFQNTPLLLAAMNGHNAVVKMLLQSSEADPDSRDVGNRTPLWVAAALGRVTIVTLLLDTGQVSVDSKDADGRTPLFEAAANGKIDTVELLLATGQVDINTKDKEGKTPISQAAEEGFENVVSLLKAHGAGS